VRRVEPKMNFDAKAWHVAVKEVFEASPGYRQYARTAPCGGRLIPLCTPVPAEVDVLMIGINHAAFDEYDEAEAERIATEFTADVPVVNTYLTHNHNFARQLRAVVGKAGLEITDRWVGTNRCPVQTGTESFHDAIEKQKFPWFEEAAQKMDDLLKGLVRSTSPKCVVLAGDYAAKLYYKGKFKITELAPSVIKTSQGKTLLVPIPHVSRASYHAEAIERLRAFVKPVLEGQLTL